MNRTRFKDYAILYRGNHQSRIFEKALMTNRIPYRISGGTSFFSRTEIKDIMAYLKLLVNPDEDTAFPAGGQSAAPGDRPHYARKTGPIRQPARQEPVCRELRAGLSNTSPGVASVRCRPLPTGWCGSAIRRCAAIRWRRHET